MIIHLHFKTKKAAIDIGKQLAAINDGLIIYVQSYYSTFWVSDYKSEMDNMQLIGTCGQLGFIASSKVKEENSAVAA